MVTYFYYFWEIYTSIKYLVTTVRRSANEIFKVFRTTRTIYLQQRSRNFREPVYAVHVWVDVHLAFSLRLLIFSIDRYSSCFVSVCVYVLSVYVFFVHVRSKLGNFCAQYTAGIRHSITLPETESWATVLFRRADKVIRIMIEGYYGNQRTMRNWERVRTTLLPTEAVVKRNVATCERYIR